MISFHPANSWGDLVAVFPSALPLGAMRNHDFNIADYSREMEQLIGSQEQVPLFWKAFSFAVDAHQYQRRKSGEPYVSHPCQVARIMVRELGVTDPATLAAALLHDTVEDVEEVSFELVGELFGQKVELDP